MTRHVAFLRAINVGGHTVKMDRLRALFEELRFANVETFIASGNVLFDTTSTVSVAMEARIERHLAAALGYEVATFVRPLVALPDIVAGHPFDSFERDGHSLTIGFLKDTLDADRCRALQALETGYDEFHPSGREVFWLCHGRISDSKAWGSALDRVLGKLVTFRNVTTVRKLAAKASATAFPLGAAGAARRGAPPRR